MESYRAANASDDAPSAEKPTRWKVSKPDASAALAEGLGSGIIGMGGVEKKAVETLLGLPAGYDLVCILKLGVPEGSVPIPPPRPRW